MRIDKLRDHPELVFDSQPSTYKGERVTHVFRLTVRLHICNALGHRKYGHEKSLVYAIQTIDLQSIGSHISSILRRPVDLTHTTYVFYEYGVRKQSPTGS